MKSLISRFLTTKVPVLKNGIQTVLAKCFGLRKIEVIHDYGMFSVAPTGSYGASWNIAGSEDNKVGIAYKPSLVPSIMDTAKEGESIFGNFLKKATMHFNDQGQSVITLPDNFILNCKNANITATENVNVTAVNINLNNALQITQSAVSCSVPTNFTGGISSNGVSIDENHGHTNVTNGPNVSGGVNP